MNRQDQYALTLTQIRGLLEDERDLIANLANVTAVIRENLGFFWIGFYIVREDQLVLGPFQGPVACTRISKGKGVCGTAWQKKETIVVEDVHEFPGHIACNPISKSEIVIPLISKNGSVFGVLDVDSDKPGDFDMNDARSLEAVCSIIMECHDLA